MFSIFFFKKLILLFNNDTLNCIYLQFFNSTQEILNLNQKVSTLALLCFQTQQSNISSANSVSFRGGAICLTDQ